MFKWGTCSWYRNIWTILSFESHLLHWTTKNVYCLVKIKEWKIYAYSSFFLRYLQAITNNIQLLTKYLYIEAIRKTVVKISIYIVGWKPLSYCRSYNNNLNISIRLVMNKGITFLEIKLATMSPLVEWYPHYIYIHLKYTAVVSDILSWVIY